MNLICPTRDAVVDFLNTQIVALRTALGITPVFTAVAAYEESSDLQTLAGARLLVIPRELSSELTTFDEGAERKPTVDVVVQYKAAAVTPAVLDPYVKLSEAICDLLLGQTMTNGTVCIEANWPLTKADGAFVRADLQDFQVLTCLTTYTFVIEN